MFYFYSIFWNPTISYQDDDFIILRLWEHCYTTIGMSVFWIQAKTSDMIFPFLFISCICTSFAFFSNDSIDSYYYKNNY